MAQTDQPLLVVAGPTASGKSAMAAALAQRFDGEVVSADSMQIYREMDIATAQPSAEEMRGVPHHLLGILAPSEGYSVASYAAHARAVIADIHRRGKIPVLAGGTGLYIQAVVDHILFAPQEGDERIRTQLRELLETKGPEALWSELNAVDPAYAKELHPHNTNRIIRAIELYRTSGLTMAEQREASRREPSPYRLFMLGLTCRDRQKLYDRIDSRVDRMVSDGLLDEARAFLAREDARTARQAIGYKELAGYFDGSQTLDEAIEHVKRETRRYAKRQLTWFRRDERIYWIYVDEYQNFHEVYKKCEKVVERSGIL